MFKSLNNDSDFRVYEMGESKDLTILFLTPNIKNPISTKFLNYVKSSTIETRIIGVESSGNGFSFAKSWNKGIETFKQNPSKFLMLSHDDVGFTPDFLENMHSLTRSHLSDSIMMPVSYEGGRLVDPFMNFLPPNFFIVSSLTSYLPIFMLNFFEGLRHVLHKRYFPETEFLINANDLIEVPPVTFPRLFPICIMPQVTINKLSHFDENFYFGEDIEFTFRAFLTGTRFGLIKGLSVNHYGSFNVGKREFKKGKYKAEHIHKELISHRNLWAKYKNDYEKLKKIAKSNFFIL